MYSDDKHDESSNKGIVSEYDIDSNTGERSCIKSECEEIASENSNYCSDHLLEVQSSIISATASGPNLPSVAKAVAVAEINEL